MNWALIIDDNLIDGKTISLVLKKSGFDCVCATDLNLALEEINKKTPDLIFLDIVMPGLSGFEIIKMLKNLNSTKDVPIIMMSGKNQTSDVTQAIQLGAVDYIVKPIDPLVVQQKIKKFIDDRQDEFCEIQLSPHQIIEAKQSYSFTIQSISEFGLSGLSESFIEPQTSIELTELPEDIFGTSKVLVRCLGCEQRSDGKYSANLTYIGMTESIRQIIRSSCRKLFVQAKEREVA